MLSEIENEICNHYGVTIEQLRSNDRTSKVCFAKSVLWFFLYEYFDFTARTIAKEYGRSIRNIRYSIAKSKFLIRNDKEFREAYKHLLDKIKTPYAKDRSMRPQEGEERLSVFI